MSPPRATLKHIAEATGFSANTVSLALRNSPRIPEKTRALILKEAERLSYSPNHIARSLASRATRTVGLVMTDILNPTLTLAAHTIERELSHAGYAVMFAASDGRVELEKQAIELFLSYQVDGMLVYPANRSEYAHIQSADERGTPVLLLVDVPTAKLDIVTIDDRLGAFRALSHACKAGHSTIAMLDGGAALGNFDKLDGARQAVRQAGLSDDALTVFQPASHAASCGYDLMQEVMELHPRPTALFASTDSIAFGVLHWCRDAGVRVPEDLAVIGYDNAEGARYSVPPLTTVNYAADEISRIGVDRILRRLEKAGNWEGPRRTMIEPELIIRGTI